MSHYQCQALMKSFSLKNIAILVDSLALELKFIFVDLVANSCEML